jgi:hypothetical protein
LQTLSDLYKEWNSTEMCENRKKCAEAMEENKLDVNNNRDKIETVLEFLERVCSYYKKDILNKKSLWDNFGFYILRYYQYNKENIDVIRKVWKDRSLYEDMQGAYPELIEDELNQGKTEKSQKNRQKIIDETSKIINDINETKMLFLTSEKHE